MLLSYISTVWSCPMKRKLFFHFLASFVFMIECSLRRCMWSWNKALLFMIKNNIKIQFNLSVYIFQKYIPIFLTASSKEIEIRYRNKFNLHYFNCNIRKVIHFPSAMQSFFKILYVAYLARDCYTFFVLRPHETIVS